MSVANSLPQDCVPVIDAHCHLEAAYYGERLPEVLARARASSLRGFVAVGASGVAKGSDEAIMMAEQNADIVASIGIHPHDAQNATPNDLAYIEERTSHPKVRSIGEVGLDYYYEHAPKEAQKELFAAFIRMAHRTNQPLMLHIRDAHQDCLALFDQCGIPQRGVMIHCFTAGLKEAQAYAERGFMLSIPGVVTFKNAQGLRDALASIPRDQLMVETDAPYLAPVPRRGQQNEPAFVQHTLTQVADVLGVPKEELALHVLANTQRFFRLGDASH